MTFFEFCCKRFDEEHAKKGKYTPIFDMACDARRDPLYPKDWNKRHLIRAYLQSQSASDLVLRNFEAAFDEYEKTCR